MRARYLLARGIVSPPHLMSCALPGNPPSGTHAEGIERRTDRKAA